MSAIKIYLRAMLWGSLIGTVILGVGGRLLMRKIAVMGGLEGGFSWGGSIEVVLVGLITGAIAGVLYPIYRNLRISNTFLRGSVYGLLVYVAFIIIPVSGKGAAKGFPDFQLYIILGFGILFLIFGLTLAYLVPNRKISN